MATQYVVLGSRQKNNGSTVAVHTDTPGGNNDAGTPWTTALSQSFGGTFNSVVPADVMPGGRQAELDAGTRFEWVLDVGYNANLTPAQKLTEVTDAITAQEPDELTYRQNELRFWGQTGAI